jgi:8-oxo-dGTP diphosphatase / 2-hydroxy-dATP diphosphatase
MPVEDEQTLCHIIDGNKLLLKKASRGVSKGRWNAPGGKLDFKEEPPEECAIREVYGETGLTIKNLFKHGIMYFHFLDENKNQTMMITVHLFSTTDFEGELKFRYDEDEVKWFDKDKLPWDELWPDDEFWISSMLKKKKFNAHFYFNKEDKGVAKFTMDFFK